MHQQVACRISRNWYSPPYRIYCIHRWPSFRSPNPQSGLMRAMEKLCTGGAVPVNDALSVICYQSYLCRSDFLRGNILLIRTTPSRAAPPYSKRSANSGMLQAPFWQDISNGMSRAGGMLRIAFFVNAQGRLAVLVTACHP